MKFSGRFSYPRSSASIRGQLNPLFIYYVYLSSSVAQTLP
jgi:hypothetical protein